VAPLHAGPRRRRWRRIELPIIVKSGVELSADRDGQCLESAGQPNPLGFCGIGVGELQLKFVVNSVPIYKVEWRNFGAWSDVLEVDGRAESITGLPDPSHLSSSHSQDNREFLNWRGLLLGCLCSIESKGPPPDQRSP